MSVIKKVYELVVNNKSANKELDNTRDKVEGVTKETQNLNRESKKTPALLKGISKGFKAIGTAIKAAGIGIVIGLVAKLGEAFSKNQKFLDGFNVSMEFLSRVMNDFVNFLIDSVEPVKAFFTDIFENPLENVKALGTAIKDNIIERFKSSIEVFGLAGKAIKQFFEGDFSGAMDTAKEAGKELVDVATGVDNSADKIAETVTKGAKAIGEYATETYNAAEAQVELKKQADLAESTIRQSILLYQNEIEKQRQIRDDVSLTLDEREKANNRVGELLQEQGKKEKALAQLRVNEAQAALDANEGNVELQKALIDAKTEQIDVEERITGFISEQKTNEVALQEERRQNLQEIRKIGAEKEQLAKIELENELENNRLLIERTISDEEERNAALLAAESQYNNALAELEEEKLTKLQEIQDKFIPEEEQGLSEAEKFELERERKREQFEKELEDLKIQEEEKAELLKEFDKDTSEEAIRLAEEETARKKMLKEQEVQMALGALSVITNALAEGSDVAKGFAAAEAIWSAYKGINAALADGEIPFPIRVANSIAIGVTAFKNVQSILSTDPEKGASGMRGNVNNSTPRREAAPRFDTVGDSRRVRDAEIENESKREPIEAFVVSKKVTSQQELDRTKNNNSRFI